MKQHAFCNYSSVLALTLLSELLLWFEMVLRSYCLSFLNAVRGRKILGFYPILETVVLFLAKSGGILSNPLSASKIFSTHYISGVL